MTLRSTFSASKNVLLRCTPVGHDDAGGSTALIELQAHRIHVIRIVDEDLDDRGLVRPCRR